MRLADKLNNFSDISFSADPQAVLLIMILLICLVTFLEVKCWLYTFFPFLYFCSIFPKTDYTYSRASPHRKELAPGVIPMPNMSRRSLVTMRQHGSSENRISSSAVAMKRDVTESRFFDNSAEGRVMIYVYLIFFL
jgi:hypothetical protein